MSPALSAAGVVALAMGIGANTAIFSLADALLIKPLSVPDGRGVYVIAEIGKTLRSIGVHCYSRPQWRRFAESARGWFRLCGRHGRMSMPR